MVGAEFNILFGLVDIVDWIYENFHKKTRNKLSHGNTCKTITFEKLTHIHTLY